MQQKVLAALLTAAVVSSCTALFADESAKNASPQAQDADRPGLSLPSLDFQPGSSDVARYDRYFYFHKTGVSYRAALADIHECDSYSRLLLPMSLVPEFVPVGGDLGADTQTEKTLINAWFMWGPVGAGIAAIVMEDMKSDMERTNLRRCMAFKGYQRYGTSRSIWSQIEGPNQPATESKLALIASGARPQREAIEP